MHTNVYTAAMHRNPTFEALAESGTPRPCATDRGTSGAVERGEQGEQGY